jgi:hypothetical protein
LPLAERHAAAALRTSGQPLTLPNCKSLCICPHYSCSNTALLSCSCCKPYWSLKALSSTFLVECTLCPSVGLIWHLSFTLTDMLFGWIWNRVHHGTVHDIRCGVVWVDAC